MKIPQIFVQNRQRKIALATAELERFARRALPLCLREAGFGLTELEEINVRLISDRRIAELHARFMRISGPTDVITFQHGDIGISVETAARQASGHHTSLDYELRLYLVHGLLHLHGYDDRDAPARRLMETLQEKIVQNAAE